MLFLQIIFIVLSLLFSMVITGSFTQKRKASAAEKEYISAFKAHSTLSKQGNQKLKQETRAKTRNINRAEQQIAKTIHESTKPVLSVRCDEGKISVSPLTISLPEGTYRLDGSMQAELILYVGKKRVSKGDPLGGAIVGGALFGAVGAVAGAALSSESSSEVQTVRPALKIIAKQFTTEVSFTDKTPDEVIALFEEIKEYDDNFAAAEAARENAIAPLQDDLAEARAKAADNTTEEGISADLNESAARLEKALTAAVAENPKFSNSYQQKFGTYPHESALFWVLLGLSLAGTVWSLSA